MALAIEHNWDDGFAVPRAIADHQNCDRSVALQLFWLSGADEVALGKASRDEYNSDWFDFSLLIAERLRDGFYNRAAISFSVPLTKVQVYQYRKDGLPDVFLSDSIAGA